MLVAKLYNIQNTPKPSSRINIQYHIIHLSVMIVIYADSYYYQLGAESTFTSRYNIYIPPIGTECVPQEFISINNNSIITVALYI